MKKMNNTYVALALLIIQPALIHGAAQAPLDFKTWIAQQENFIRELPIEFQREQFIEFQRAHQPAQEQEELKVQAVPPSYEEAAGIETAEGEVLALLMQPRPLGYEIGRVYAKVADNIGKVSPQLINKLRHYLEMEVIKNVNDQLKRLNLNYDPKKVTARFAVPYFAHSVIQLIAEGNDYVRTMAAVYKADPSESALAVLLDQISHETGGIFKSQAGDNLKAMQADLLKK